MTHITITCWFYNQRSLLALFLMDMQISRAHRISDTDSSCRNNKSEPRPIIAQFINWRVVEEVWQKIITLEQSNLTTNNENRNKHTVTKINHPSEINQNNPTIPEESSTEKEIILIEMTDKSTNHLPLANEKSMKSPTKKTSNTKRKEKEKPAATIELHGNLKNTINKIDSEMIDFAKKYEQEQELINNKNNRHH